MSNFLITAKKIAHEAGALLRRGYGNVEQIEHKGVVDLITEFDRQSEALIVEALRQAFPTHAIRAEEGSGKTAESEYEWLVDPVDGTTNFAHGFPVFAISLALTHRGRPITGVVYDPLRDELFAAEL